MLCPRWWKRSNHFCSIHRGNEALIHRKWSVFQPDNSGYRDRCKHVVFPPLHDRERVHNTYPDLIIARADPHSSLRSTFHQEIRIRSRLQTDPPPREDLVSFHRLRGYIMPLRLSNYDQCTPCGSGKPLLTFVPLLQRDFTLPARWRFLLLHMHSNDLQGLLGGWSIDLRVTRSLLFSFERTREWR